MLVPLGAGRSRRWRASINWKYENAIAEGANPVAAVASLIENVRPALVYHLELFWDSLSDPDGCRYD
jgi:hypothetical protein